MNFLSWRWVAILRSIGLERVLVVVSALAATCVVQWTPINGWLGGQGLDGMMALNTVLPRAERPGSDVVIVAVDEESYRRAPLKDKPRVLWTPEMALVQDKVMEAGAAVIGWDIIISASIRDQLADPRYELPLRKSLYRWGRQGRLVLSKIGYDNDLIEPEKSLAGAAGGAANIRSVNVHEDGDSIIRRMPSSMTKDDGSLEPVLPVELAARFRKQSAEALLAPLGGLGADMYPYYSGEPGAFPTYSLVDLLHCAERSDTNFFNENFAGKVVLLGLTLEVEDRKLTTARWVAGDVQQQPSPRCTTPPTAKPTSALLRDSVSGVYMHATAIDNLLHGPLLRPPQWPVAIVLILAVALLGGMLPLVGQMALMPVLLLVLGGIQTVGGTLALRAGWILPVLEMLVAMAVSAILMFGARYVLIERKRRQVQRQFEKYVSPNFVRELIDHPDRIKTSGEKREVSFLFTDLQGFTNLVEASDPEKLRPLLNAYLDGVINAIFAHYGTVDKIIGDAVVAMFGAPLPLADHHEQAYQAAMAIDRFTEKFRAEQAANGVKLGVTRIGVNSGMAVIGDFGGSNLFDYTALGNAINTAARLESANKYFGSRICVSEDTRVKLTQFDGRPIGDVVVKGRSVALPLFDATPLPRGAAQQLAYMGAFALLNEPAAAQAAFVDFLAMYPDDGLARFHLERLQRGEQGRRIVLQDK
jgi:adenylate cyclase